MTLIIRKGLTNARARLYDISLIIAQLRKLVLGMTVDHLIPCSVSQWTRQQTPASGIPPKFPTKQNTLLVSQIPRHVP